MSLEINERDNFRISTTPTHARTRTYAIAIDNRDVSIIAALKTRQVQYLKNHTQFWI